MSIALLIAAAAAKLRPANPDAEMTKRIAELERDLADARQDRDRWETLARRWETRYVETMLQPHHQAAMAQQYNTLGAQSALNAQLAQQQVNQMLNAQNAHQIFGSQMNVGAFCNCIPARHDMFLLGN